MSITVQLICLLIITPIVLIWARSSRRPPLPPGPHRTGKTKYKITTQPWKVYRKMAKEYGPIMCIQASFGSYAFVLDTQEAITELFEKRSKVFSCRPRWVMAELSGRQNNVGLMYYGERLRNARKVLHRGIGPQTVPYWEQLFNYESLKILSDVRSSPERFFDSVPQNVESMIVRFTYGHEADSEFLELAKQVNTHTAIALQPGRWMVNYFPLLAYVPSWVPGAGFQKMAKDAKKLYYKLTRPPFERVKKELQSGLAPPSFVSHSLADLVKYPHLGYDEATIQSAAGSIFNAAIDTTSTAILTFFLMAATHPEVQDKAFQEIQSVIGLDRLPRLEDQSSLPYLECLLKEILRFNPPIPVLTHSPNEEDNYLGYRIPKKSWVFGNVWSVMHNEAEYDEPERFNPDRFMPAIDKPLPLDPRNFVFGAGRRICPGISFANSLIFLTMSRAIALFEIRPPPGEILEIEFTTGLISRPKSFRCLVTPRKSVSQELLAQLDEPNLKACFEAI